MATKKPRRVRWHPTFNTLDIAANNVSKPLPADIDDVMRTMRTAARAFCEGHGSNDHWAVLAGHVDMALAIERQGIVRGLSEFWQLADEVVQALYSRANIKGEWVTPTLHAHEIYWGVVLASSAITLVTVFGAAGYVWARWLA